MLRFRIKFARQMLHLYCSFVNYAETVIPLHVGGIGAASFQDELDVLFIRSRPRYCKVIGRPHIPVQGSMGICVKFE